MMFEDKVKIALGLYYRVSLLLVLTIFNKFKVSRDI